MFSAFLDTDIVTLQRDQFVQMLHRGTQAFIVGRRRLGDTVHIGNDLVEDPRIAVDTARDHDAVTFRCQPHMAGIGGGINVSVADNGNGCVDRLTNRLDTVKINGRGI